MSFSSEVKREIIDIKIKKYCCRSAFLLGMLADCPLSEADGKTVGKFTTLSEENRDLVERMLRGVWKTGVETSEGIRMGVPYYTLSFEIGDRAAALMKLCKGGEEIFDEDFCPSCRACFMRGVFVSNGTVSDPMTGYHMELKFKNAHVAKRIYELLEEDGIPPKIVNRNTSVGLYYKNSGGIEDMLTYLGTVKSVFDLMNAKIEREIRNSVNRSTNCVAGNISKSVSAAQKQIAAIAEIEAAGKLPMLESDLFETAKLRADNPSLSLAELARVHNPPISKSGLNHRLAKIIEYAEEIRSAGEER
jgi:DNA-binding protein WhiA